MLLLLLTVVFVVCSGVYYKNRYHTASTRSTLSMKLLLIFAVSSWIILISALFGSESVELASIVIIATSIAVYKYECKRQTG